MLLTGPLTVHGSVPSLAVLAAIVVGNVDPPSVERSIFTFPGRLVDVHVSVCDEPIAHDSPPFGDVTVSVGCTIVKLALLLSRIVASDTLTMLTRAVVLTGPLTVHGSVPSLAVLANSVVGKLAPPSVERSTFTFPLTPLDVHVIVCDEPIAQLSAPFGELTVIDGPPGVIVKLMFEMSKKILPTASTFILAVVVAVFGITNASDPSLGVLAANTVGKVCPPSVDIGYFYIGATYRAGICVVNQPGNGLG